MKNNAIRIDEIILGLNEKETVLLDKILAILGLKEEQIIDYEIVKKAIDSRDKKRILFVYSVDVEIQNPENYLAKTFALVKGKMKRHRVRLQAPYVYLTKTVSVDESRVRPIVIGSGPSGLFAGLLLARAGLKPLIVERGKDVDLRIKDVEKFFATGELDVKSNIQFGEGGAGTFSDGKLHTLIDNPRKKFIFEELIKSGALPEIAYDAQPHIGTDKLRQIVKNIRQKIIRLGGEVRFEKCLTDIEIVDGKISTVVLNRKEKISVSELILATGHSARDTYEMLHKRNVEIQAKPFSIGVRIEHSTEMINKAQYGEFFAHPKLPTARYRLVAHLEKNRPVYSFCMCPGGTVVAASSEEGRLVTNGMSEHAQNGFNSNSALLVNVLPSDFDSNHPLAGIEFQRLWEERAYLAGGGNYKAPAQLVGDFLQNKPSEKISSVASTYGPGVTMTSLRDCLPKYVLASLREALPILDRKVKGFAHPDAILIGVETRSSSPVKIVRDETLQSNIKGIYPTGEGAGYAGGIISAAIDGLMVAEVIIEKYSGKK